LYHIVGETYWVSTRCDSIAFQGRRLEGTRITTQNMGKTGFDFAIRTPCTPSRWEEYDEEMSAAWEVQLDLLYCNFVGYGLLSLHGIGEGSLRKSLETMTCF
jgi:hypothetical protein